LGSPGTDRPVRGVAHFQIILNEIMKAKKGRSSFVHPTIQPSDHSSKGEGNKPLESNIFDEGHNYNETGLAYRQAQKGRVESLAFPGPVCTEEKNDGPLI